MSNLQKHGSDHVFSEFLISSFARDWTRGSVLDVSRRLADLLGMSPHASIGTSVGELLTARGRDIAGLVSIALVRSRPISGVIPLRRPDGSSLPVHFAAFLSDDGPAPRVYLTCEPVVRRPGRPRTGEFSRFAGLSAQTEPRA